MERHFKQVLSSEVSFQKYPLFKFTTYNLLRECTFRPYKHDINYIDGIQNIYELLKIIDSHFIDFEEIYFQKEMYFMDLFKMEKEVFDINQEVKHLSHEEKLRKRIINMEQRRIKYFSSYIKGLLIFADRASYFTEKMLNGCFSESDFDVKTIDRMHDDRITKLRKIRDVAAEKVGKKRPELKELILKTVLLE